MPPNARTSPPPKRWARLLWDYRWRILRTLGITLVVAVMVAPFVWFSRLMIREWPWWWAAVSIAVAAFLTLGAIEWVFRPRQSS